MAPDVIHLEEHRFLPPNADDPYAMASTQLPQQRVRGVAAQVNVRCCAVQHRSIPNTQESLEIWLNGPGSAAKRRALAVHNALLDRLAAAHEAYLLSLPRSLLWNSGV